MTIGGYTTYGVEYPYKVKESRDAMLTETFKSKVIAGTLALGMLAMPTAAFAADNAVVSANTNDHSTGYKSIISPGRDMRYLDKSNEAIAWAENNDGVAIYVVRAPDAGHLSAEDIGEKIQGRFTKYKIPSKVFIEHAGHGDTSIDYSVNDVTFAGYGLTLWKKGFREAFVTYLTAKKAELAAVNKTVSSNVPDLAKN